MDTAAAAVSKQVTVDPINSPPHYTAGGIETIYYIEAKLSLEGFLGYCRGNAIKYISRAGLKDDAAQDLRKAAWFCERAAKALDAHKEKQ